MKNPDIPENEAERMQALLRYRILDTEAEAIYDDITKLSSYICETPIAAITLIDGNRQWCKSRVGFEENELPRNVAFCAHTIHESKPLVVSDALHDARFCDSPLVALGPKIRFYAGAPLVTPDGYALGALCVLDQVTRELSPAQIEALECLARQVSANFELRLLNMELRKANEAKTKLFSIVGHDLRGPFTPILGYAQLLRDEAPTLDPAEITRLGSGIHRTGTQVLSLIEDLLTWARHESGSLISRPEDLRVDQLLEDVIALFTDTARAKQISLKMFSDGELAVHADRDMLRTVIRNLVANALKFTPSGGRIELAAEAMGTYAEIEVSDSGCGLSPEAVAAFHRTGALPSTLGTACESGSGIGLPLCKEFVEQNGGTLLLRSEVGKGSTFVIRLPILKK